MLPIDQGAKGQVDMRPVGQLEKWMQIHACTHTDTHMYTHMHVYIYTYLFTEIDR